MENVLVLALMGILAGASGGLAIGIVTGRTASTSSTTPSQAARLRLTS